MSYLVATRVSAVPVSPTEVELTSLRAVARHGTIRKAADALSVSCHTVDAHLDSLRWKTGLRYLPQLVWWAAEQGCLFAPAQAVGRQAAAR